MKKFMFGAAAIAMVALAPAAQAVSLVIPVGTVGNPHFTATADADGTVSGSIGHDGIVGAFSDLYTFTLGASGFGTGSLTTTTLTVGSATDVNFTKVTINGVAATLTALGGGKFETAYVDSIPIYINQLNQLLVEGISKTNGSYGGQITFIPSAAPEPAAWGMMIVGFGLLGGTMRYRRRKTTVSFA